MSNVLRASAASLAVLVLLLAPGAAAGDPGVVPGLSVLDVESKLGTPPVTVDDLDTQAGALGPLAAGVVQSGGTGGTLTHDIHATAVFDSARSGSVHLDYSRNDTKPFGTSIAFFGEARFRYEFTVAQATTVTVDYDVLGSETPEPSSGPSWWAMSGFDINVDGQHQYVNFSQMFLLMNPKPPSPQAFQGSYTVNLAPGSGFIEIDVGASASGNQWGVERDMLGTFHFQIGGPEPWTDLGFALAGTHGEPQLVGTGSLVGGAPLALALGNTLENTLTTLIVGFSQLAAPFKGGVLVPAADVLFPGLATDASGDLVLATTWPLGVPAGVELYCQVWLADPAGPFGFSASNGVQATVP